MIYLCSRNKRLFETDSYSYLPFNSCIELLDKLKQIQFDSETMGLDCHTKPLLTVQLGNKENQIVFDWTTMLAEEKEAYKNFMESDKLFVGHNLMFDLTFMYKQGIYPKHIYDTMIAEQLIYLGYPRVITASLYRQLGLHIDGYEYITPEDSKKEPYYELSYALKSTAMRRINVDIDKTVRGKIIDEGLSDRVVVYASGDVMWLDDIKAVQEIELQKQELTKAVTFECEFVKSLAYTKYCGVHLDAIKWQDKMDADNAKLAKALTALNDWTIEYDKGRGKYSKLDLQGDLFLGFKDKPECTINWSSQKQVIPLFEELGIKVDTFDKKTKKKKKSIEKKILAPQKDDFPIIPLFLEYQEADKVVTTYGQNWLNAINPKTHRIHVELHSVGTDTSRVSSGGGPYKLNQQNLPNDSITRGCFTAEKGNVWLSCDYSGQESCIIASVAHDEAMIKELSKPNGDIHSLVAYMSYPNIIPRDTPIEDIKKKYHEARQNSKGIEFSVNYGGDANTIASNKGIPIKEAEKIYNDFMSGFPGVAKYQAYCRKEVLNKGYILMNPILKHRAHIYDAEWMFYMQEKFKSGEFWKYYNEMKRTDPYCDTVQDVKRYFKRKSESEKQSINYRMNVCDLR